jgi:hypothetical protein
MTLFDRAVPLEYCLSLDLSTLLLSERRALLAAYSGWPWLLVAIQSRLLRRNTFQDLYTDSVPVRLGYQMNIHVSSLKTKSRLLFLETQSVPRCKHFSSRL